MLNVDKIDVFYGSYQALWGVSLTIKDRELTVLVGPNGAGKTTTINAITGFVPISSGTVEYKDEHIENLRPDLIVGKGIVQIPEGRMLFPRMTVQDNLKLGAYLPHARNKMEDTLEHVYQVFPVLKERNDQLVGTMSGGERQMVAVGRGMMSRPEVFLFDEPSLGLAPMLVEKIFEVIEHLLSEDFTIFLVEQHVVHALQRAHNAYVIEGGRIVMEGEGEELLKSEYVKKSYLGI